MWRAAVAEGVLTSRSAHNLALKLGVECPIMNGIYRTLHGAAPRRPPAAPRFPMLANRMPVLLRAAAPALPFQHLHSQTFLSLVAHQVVSVKESLMFKIL